MWLVKLGLDVSTSSCALDVEEADWTSNWTSTGRATGHVLQHQKSCKQKALYAYLDATVKLQSRTPRWWSPSALVTGHCLLPLHNVHACEGLQDTTVNTKQQTHHAQRQMLMQCFDAQQHLLLSKRHNR
jgi:hypothetical protein